MSIAGRFKDEKLSLPLLDQVIRFKKIYFAANWAHYDTAVPDTPRIVPNAGLQAILRKDYDQMDEMFPTKRLSFDEIVARLEELQKRINVLKKPLILARAQLFTNPLARRAMNGPSDYESLRRRKIH